MSKAWNFIVLNVMRLSEYSETDFLLSYLSSKQFGMCTNYSLKKLVVLLQYLIIDDLKIASKRNKTKNRIFTRNFDFLFI